MFDNSQLKDINIIQPAPRFINGQPNPFFPAVPDLEFTQIRNTSDANGKSITFTWKDKLGANIDLRIFEPRFDAAKTTEEKFKKSKDLTHSQLGHISAAYLPKAEHDAIKGVDWDSYINAMITALGWDRTTGVPTRAKGVMTAAKVVYRQSAKDSKWYSGMATVPPFLSTSIHPKTFTVDPQYDKFEKEEVKPDGPTTQNNNAGFNTQPPTTQQNQSTAGTGTGFGGASGSSSGF